jgi:cysteine sulfinate desulfinase/cysteine desulfurase-like protein
MRFSLGRSNTVQQVDSLVEALEASVAHLRRISVHA